MKLTLAPTTDQSGLPSDQCHCVISIEHPSDDLSLVEMIELVKALLLSAQYDPATVEEYLGDE